MASAWAATLPVVTVPSGTTPKRVTFVYPYYQSPKFLADQIAKWWDYDEALRWQLSAVIVDDGSPEPARLTTNLPFPIRLFRIERDIPWNWLAARNIGAHHAAAGWLVMTDMDHVVPHATAYALVGGQHDPGVVYGFSRREHSGDAVTPHSASFFMTREMFWRIGGYDERLSGVYGTDGAYRKRVLATAPVHILSDELVRYEYVADSSVTSYDRKTPAMAEARAKRFASLPPGPPTVLSFPYHEVTA